MSKTVFNISEAFALALVYCSISLVPSTALGQGTASPGPLSRPAPHIDTKLPPITVDFRDVAEQAGLTAENVSGGAEKKDYILETTGNGVIIFDFDNDRLMDIFFPN